MSAAHNMRERTKVPIASLADEDLHSERVVLGSLLLDPQLMHDLSLSPSDFSGNHVPVFDSTPGLWVSSQNFDPILVNDELRRRGKHWRASGTFVSSLTDGIPRHTAIDGHVARVRESAARRKLAKLCEDTLARCYNAAINPSDLLESHRASVELIDTPTSRGADLGLICGADVTAEATQWLYEPYLPVGQVTLLVGDPGAGKTWAALSFTAAITNGRSPFNGDRREPQNVLYLSNEDAPSILRGRLDRLGGDPSKTWFESSD